MVTQREHLVAIAANLLVVFGAQEPYLCIHSCRVRDVIAVRANIHREITRVSCFYRNNAIERGHVARTKDVAIEQGHAIPKNVNVGAEKATGVQ
jgi:hypothetical protein